MGKAVNRCVCRDCRGGLVLGHGYPLSLDAGSGLWLRPTALSSHIHKNHLNFPVLFNFLYGLASSCHHPSKIKPLPSKVQSPRTASFICSLGPPLSSLQAALTWQFLKGLFCRVRLRLSSYSCMCAALFWVLVQSSTDFFHHVFIWSASPHPSSLKHRLPKEVSFWPLHGGVSLPPSTSQQEDSLCMPARYIHIYRVSVDITVIMGVTSCSFCHILLVRSKSQVPPTPEGGNWGFCRI